MHLRLVFYNLTIRMLFNVSSRAALLTVALVGLILTAPIQTQPGAPQLSQLDPEHKLLIDLPPSGVTTLRVVTFNVHYARDVTGLVRSLALVPEICAADVLLIQEIEKRNAEAMSRTEKLARAFQMNYVYAPARPLEEGGTHGLAILSRYPLWDIEIIPLPRFDLHVNTRRRIALGATVDLGVRRVRIYNLHLDTRLNTKDRLSQLRPVIDAALSQPVAEVVIGGDFNTNPFRWAFRLFPVFPSDQAGAVDSFMQEHGFQAPFTNKGGTSSNPLLPLRLDSIYPRNLCVTDHGIARSVEASDHVPLWMDVQWCAPNAHHR